MPRISRLVFACVAALFPLTAAAGQLPDLSKTPGKWRVLSTDRICSIHWGLDRRHVTPAMKSEVFARYGCTGNNAQCCTPDDHDQFCEIDHLISRELGGDDVVDNLWPQSYGGNWNARDKDRLENRLHKEVCDGNLALRRARQMITNDWKAAYRQYFGNSP